ncbi:MAG TPA: tripartite tricarboxylate transporter TctB family protein [Xanthobacteraceae bacterium]|nr:tripartite tricarboxylate transporter TctB family protein [Xanthobacteraceae bacterium]
MGPASNREFRAGGLMVLIGLVAVIEGQTYNIGTMRQMGPGFMPVALGILLVFLGILIAGTGITGGTEDSEALPARRDWRGYLCIIAGPALFILLGKYGGLAPATFACVFVSAMGDRTATWKSAALLALAITIFGVLLFAYVLKVPFPILKLFNLVLL